MIKSIDKALKILDYISGDSGGTPIRLSRIAQAMDMHPSTCARILATMCACDYLEKVSRTEGYVLGPRSFLLSGHRPYRMDLLRVAVPYMLELCSKVHENVSLSTYHRGALYAAYSVHYEDVGIRRRGTLRGMLFASAGGRVILAFMEPLERKQLFETRGYPLPEEWPAAINPSMLEEELSRIRQDGYCVAFLPVGLAAVACPLWTGGTRVRETVGVYMPAERLLGDIKEKMIREVQLTASLINQKLINDIRLP